MRNDFIALNILFSFFLHYKLLQIKYLVFCYLLKQKNIQIIKSYAKIDVKKGPESLA